MTQPPRTQTGDTLLDSPPAELLEQTEPAFQPAVFLNTLGPAFGPAARRSDPAELMAVLRHVFPEIGDLRTTGTLPD
jgi:hypothetical protein